MEIHHLIDYHEWADQQYEAMLRQHPLPAAERLYGHLLRALELWLYRLKEQTAPHGPWEPVPPEDRAILRTDLYAALRRLVERMESTQTIAYQNSRGQGFQSAAGEIWLHLSHHATYHRGQLALLYRQAGIDPPYTDLIHWFRSVRGGELVS